MKNIKKLLLVILVSFSAISLTAQSCANFTYTISSTKPTVYFADASSCTNQTVTEWDFGDGSTGSGTNPFNQYVYSGTYLVVMWSKDTNLAVIDSIAQWVTISCARFSFTVTNVTNVATFYNNFSNCPGTKAFSWSFGDGSYGSGSNPSHTYLGPGTYKVTLLALDTFNSVIDSISKNLTLYPKPLRCNAYFTYAQAKDSLGNKIPNHVVVLDSNGGSFIGRLSFFWDFGDGNSSTLKNPTHTYTGNGPYVLCLTVSDTGCTSTYCDTLSVDSNGNVKSSEGFTIHIGKYDPNVGPTGMDENSLDNAVTLMPNPATDVLNILFKGLNSDQIYVEMTNVQGQTVYSNQFVNVSGNTNETIDVSDLNKGMYIVKFTTENNVIAKRIIVQ